MPYEVIARLASFLAIIVVMALWELKAPRRQLTVSKKKRWFANLGIVVLNSALVRVAMPVLPVGLALLASNEGWGLLNILDLPFFFEVVVGIVLLDLVVYLQHVMFHAVPLLWRLHMMHHADLDYDLTTGLRFHPFEIIISMGIKLTAVAAIGPSVFTVILFEILLNGLATFNHGNVHIPHAIDRVLRLFVVTPDMHRVHHSVTIRETNSNFGFNLPWWDRLFGTYRAQPVAGHEGMTIGLAQFRSSNPPGLLATLALPFTGKPGNYAINRWGKEPPMKKDLKE
ncbi:MAG: sterol desaturase family protein [Desulfatiglans sp.]|jgi:sterol desaturase/sphingolipid hydroxylase (fatty acid hydroxylase superfamily)|nr:sterol desaturase family protein [Thermodesulfobacteriota bacterium]MEE4354763.1 sterol desaturase family protein [Desulfatiglans sp.]